MQRLLVPSIRGSSPSLPVTWIQSLSSSTSSNYFLLPCCSSLPPSCSLRSQVSTHTSITYTRVDLDVQPSTTKHFPLSMPLWYRAGSTHTSSLTNIHHTSLAHLTSLPKQISYWYFSKCSTSLHLAIPRSTLLQPYTPHHVSSITKYHRTTHGLCSDICC